MRNSTTPTLDEIKKKLEKEDPSQIKFTFKLLFPLTEISENSTSNPTNVLDCLNLIKDLAAKVVLNSYRCGEIFLSKKNRESFLTEVSTNNKKLKEALITLAGMSKSIATPLLKHYYDYLVAINSAKLDNINIALAKAAGVDLRKRQEDAKASALDLSGVLQKLVSNGCETTSRTLKESSDNAGLEETELEVISYPSLIDNASPHEFAEQHSSSSRIDSLATFASIEVSDTTVSAQDSHHLLAADSAHGASFVEQTPDKYNSLNASGSFSDWEITAFMPTTDPLVISIDGYDASDGLDISIIENDFNSSVTLTDALEAEAQPERSAPVKKPGIRLTPNELFLAIAGYATSIKMKDDSPRYKLVAQIEGNGILQAGSIGHIYYDESEKRLLVLHYPSSDLGQRDQAATTATIQEVDTKVSEALTTVRERYSNARIMRFYPVAESNFFRAHYVAGWANETSCRIEDSAGGIAPNLYYYLNRFQHAAAIMQAHTNQGVKPEYIHRGWQTDSWSCGYHVYCVAKRLIAGSSIRKPSITQGLLNEVGQMIQVGLSGRAIATNIHPVFKETNLDLTALPSNQDGVLDRTRGEPTPDNTHQVGLQGSRPLTAETDVTMASEAKGAPLETSPPVFSSAETTVIDNASPHSSSRIDSLIPCDSTPAVTEVSDTTVSDQDSHHLPATDPAYGANIATTAFDTTPKNTKVELDAVLGTLDVFLKDCITTRVIALDYDGCLQHYDNDKAAQSRGGCHTVEHLYETNRPLWEFLELSASATNTSLPPVVIMNGSNRQTPNAEHYNAYAAHRFAKRAKSPWWAAFSGLANQLSVQCDPFVLEDARLASQHHRPTTEATTLMRYAFYDEAQFSVQLPPKNDTPILDDQYKYVQLYSQLQRCATRYPETEFTFVDDRDDILSELYKFYSEHTELIPQGVTLQLVHYQPYADNLENRSPKKLKMPIVGVGILNKQYADVVGTLAEKWSDKAKPKTSKQWRDSLLRHAKQNERHVSIDFELSYHKLSDQTPPSLKQNHNDFTYQAFLLHAKNMMDELLHLMQEQGLSDLDSAAYETLYDLLQLECINIGFQSRTLEESLTAQEPCLTKLKNTALPKLPTGSHQARVAYEEAFLARPTDSSQTINMNAPYQPSQQLIQRLINSQNYQRDVSSAFARVEHRIQGRNPDATSFLERLKDLILYKLSTLFRKKQIKSHPLYFAGFFAQKATCRTAAEQTARAVIPNDRSPGITA